MFIGSLAMAAFFLSLIAGGIAIWAAVELRSFNKSTHNVQFMPLQGPDDTELDKMFKAPNEVQDQMDKDFDNLI